MVRKILMTTVAAALFAAPAATAGNGNGKAKPLPANQALPLIDAAPTADLSAVSPISKQQAADAMAAPGAATTLAAGYPSAAAAVGAATGCASVRAHVGWGTWPYQRDLYQYTYWCAIVGDRITSYSTVVTTDQTLCTRQNTDNFVYSGGIGYFWITGQAQATWTCPIIGVVPYSVGGWLRTAYNAWLNAQLVAHS